MSNPTTTPGLHPSWCDPRCCDRYDDDIQHRSTPVRWQTGDADIEIIVRRTDEKTFSGHLSADIFIEVTVSN
ncbi:MAG: hypothetical protein LC749_11455, partial [Actinobacteria bacterium]|nr:hypothetical protein [Actinomycetota bacterium]